MDLVWPQSLSSPVGVGVSVGMLISRCVLLEQGSWRCLLKMTCLFLACFLVEGRASEVIWDHLAEKLF